MASSRHNLVPRRRRRHRAPVRPMGGVDTESPTLSASPSLLPWLQPLPLLLLLSGKATVASAESSICGRRFVLRQRDSSVAGTVRSGGAEPSSGSSEEAKRPSHGASGASNGGALSRGRGFMGAAMVEDPAVVVFAGGIGSGGTVVDSNVDAFALGAGVLAGGGGGDDGGDVVVDRDVLS